jgi:hypothetical protein
MLAPRSLAGSCRASPTGVNVSAFPVAGIVTVAATVRTAVGDTAGVKVAPGAGVKVAPRAGVKIASGASLTVAPGIAVDTALPMAHADNAVPPAASALKRRNSRRVIELGSIVSCLSWDRADIAESVQPNYDPGIDAGPGWGFVGKTDGGRGVWLKSI